MVVYVPTRCRMMPAPSLVLALYPGDPRGRLGLREGIGCEGEHRTAPFGYRSSATENLASTKKSRSEPSALAARVAVPFFAALRRCLVRDAFFPAARRLRVVADFLAVALRLRVTTAFLAAERRFLVVAAFFPALKMAPLFSWDRSDL